MAGNDGTLSRDQRFAVHAYHCVEHVPKGLHGQYRIAVNDLGANILRGGLCAAIAAIQRLPGKGALLLDDLAAARVSGLEGATGNDLGRRIRDLDVDTYMMVTREMLQIAVWLKRAVQASFPEDTGEDTE